MTIVYYTDVSPLRDDCVFNTYMHMVDDTRKNKIERLKFRDDKNLSLGAWFVLQKALMQFGYHAGECELEYEKNGKPFLKNRPETHFSISHSKSIAICAVSDFKAGIDTEHTGEFNEKLCERFFGEKERAYIFSDANTDSKKERFFRIWTLKESFVKFTGDGIGGFTNFEVDALSGTVNVISSKFKNPCVFYEFDIPEYKTSLCLEHSDNVIFRKTNITKGFSD